MVTRGIAHRLDYNRPGGSRPREIRPSTQRRGQLMAAPRRIAGTAPNPKPEPIYTRKCELSTHRAPAPLFSPWTGIDRAPSSSIRMPLIPSRPTFKPEPTPHDREDFPELYDVQRFFGKTLNNCSHFSGTGAAHPSTTRRNGRRKSGRRQNSERVDTWCLGSRTRGAIAAAGLEAQTLPAPFGRRDEPHQRRRAPIEGRRCVASAYGGRAARNFWMDMTTTPAP